MAQFGKVGVSLNEKFQRKRARHEYSLGVHGRSRDDGKGEVAQMALYDLPGKHLNGRVSIRRRDKESLNEDDYFKSIPSLKPLFRRSDFNESTPGFYINYILDNETPTGGLRLNYFTVHCSRTIEILDEFVATTNDLTIFKREPCDTSKQLTEYEERPELEFWNFLDANTRVCLDMLENYGPDSFQSLVALYRFVCLPKGYRPEQILEGHFIQNSPTFNELKRVGRDRMYWDDLLRTFPNRGCGLHFRTVIEVERQTVEEGHGL